MKSSIPYLLLLWLVSGILYAQENQSMEPDWTIWLQSSYIQNSSDEIEPNNTFQLNTANIIVNGKSTDKWSFHAMGNLKSQILMQAWVKYQAHKHLSLRAGQFKYPFGYEAYGPLVKWKFVTPSYITTSIVKKLGAEGSLYRDVGIGAESLLPVTPDVKGIIRLMVFNGNGANTSDNNNNKDVAAFIGTDIRKTLLLGLFIYSGTRHQGEYKLDESAMGLLFRLQKQSLTVQSEYIRAKYDHITSLNSITPSGYYIYATYMLPHNLEAGFRFDSYDDDAGGSKSRSTLSAGYYLNPLNRLLINYEITDNDSAGNLLTVLFQAVL